MHAPCALKSPKTPTRFPEDPKKWMYFMGRGNAYFLAGKFDSAIADYNKALELQPGGPFPLYCRGLAKLGKGDLTSGNADIKSAKAIRTDVATADKMSCPTPFAEIAQAIKEIVVSHYGDDPILGNYVLWEAVGNVLENTLKIVVGAGLTEAEKQAAYKEFRDLVVTSLTRKNFPKIAGPFVAATFVSWTADAFAPVIADAVVEVIRKKNPGWANAHPTVVELLRAGITVAIVDAAAFGVGYAQTGNPVAGAYSVLVAETFLLVQSSIELASIELSKAPSASLQQHAAQTEQITNILKNQLALCNAKKDACSKQLIASALRAQNMLDDAIAKDSIIIKSKQYPRNSR